MDLNHVLSSYFFPSVPSLPDGMHTPFFLLSSCIDGWNCQGGLCRVVNLQLDQLFMVKFNVFSLMENASNPNTSSPHLSDTPARFLPVAFPIVVHFFALPVVSKFYRYPSPRTQR
ncbi:hypothetical protein GE21DRAFT_4533 [Neurospora crassa]|uniref:Uncharacterized protein n=1 Tax=Neurospora crassa (strain ATCC 24698 / 74-OR23-1A / CBS 708.71 / DSM 1257 / FGSC 987) TaxID=367110 RepID=U9W8G3_NEUCR|nr:hypothetical protein NCU16670 [Neurospora crassa OR74A]ESA43315.1 hypothetical protein NCU16670 [Neurospora crassa OR74A]KHE89683.1 hypothetical protein GE21DRAFT_4533 [Neurospora crassa]|eukprot:XP_011394048.1 hypothetical protein NCU16670 [Neurospora crassa OR74A]